MLNYDPFPLPTQWLPLNTILWTNLKQDFVWNEMGCIKNNTSNVTSEDTKDVKDEDSKRLEFSEDEEDLIARMFNLVGKRWSLIAGRIPGRTAEEIEKYWTAKFSSSK